MLDAAHSARCNAPRMTDDRYQKLFEKIKQLSPSKLFLIERAVERHASRIESYLAPNSPPFTAVVIEALGDTLQAHHAASLQPLTKHPTEFALVQAFEQANISAVSCDSKTRAGYDIQVEDVPWSI